MNPSLQTISGIGTSSGPHAHLLAVEMGGRFVREMPEEVINEVVFRATHVSSLMEEMFRDAQAHDLLEVDGF